MAQNSKIEWTESSWNPIVGCTIATPGCTNCYAMKNAYRMGFNRKTPQYKGTAKLVKNKPVWTGKVNFAENVLTVPLRRKKPTTYFVNSMGDLFHEDVPNEWIDKVFAVMALCPQHTFQILTKRTERMRKYLTPSSNHRASIHIEDVLDLIAPNRHKKPVECRCAIKAVQACLNWPLPNIWLGVSVEDQKRADERIPFLLDTPAAVRFVSAEPLLGPIDLTDLNPGAAQTLNAFTGFAIDPHFILPGLNQVIVGGESSTNARPMHPAWARSIRDQCADAGVPFFFKQWGEWGPGKVLEDEHEGIIVCPNGIKANPEHNKCLAWNGDKWVSLYSFDDLPAEALMRVGKPRAGRLLDGVEHNSMPEPEDA